MRTQEYTIGIICALSHEAAAAVAMLDEEDDAMLEQDPADHNNYRLGQMHHHKVVIASLPAGVYGTASAATVAKDMLRSFKHLRFGLMVGVGGAAPVPALEEHDIRLGDVVISKPSGAFGGVVQFDAGKQSQSDGLVRKGSLPSPPFPLLTAVAQLQTDLELEDCDITTHLSTMFQKRPAMEKRFGFPGVENDVLYEAEYVHSESSRTCASCDPSKSVIREERESNDPRIFFGVIASSNVVMKDAILRDKLQEELGVLCFEMEAAGLADFPCLVIRGISDYSDSHKNDRWQRYAAATAAAAAKSVLRYIAAASVQIEQPILQVSDRTLQEIAGRQLAVTQRLGHELEARAYKEEIRYQDAAQKECHLYFDVLPYLKTKNINPIRNAGSCRWVFENIQYRDWLERQRDDLLWISADPGCGKSVLARALIDEDPQKKQSTCYFFFKDNENQKDISVALCCLLHQLFSQVPTSLSHALPIWERKGKTLKQEPDELWGLFLTAATDPQTGHVVCVLDALDECSEKGKWLLMRYLKDFYDKCLSKPSRDTHLKFLITSRPYADIENGLSMSRGLPTVRLAGEKETEKIKSEIDLVIKGKMDDFVRKLGIQKEMRHRIESRILSMENRTYLWVYLFMDDLEHRINRGQKFRMQDLDQLPLSVEAAYEKLLDRHTDDDRSRREALILLHIIVGAKRPMAIDELDVAFNLALQGWERDFHYDLRDGFLDADRLIARVRNLCGLFVCIVDEEVHLIHQTAKDFLIARQSAASTFQKDLAIDPFTYHECWKGAVQALACTSLWAHICIACLLILHPEYTKVVSVLGNPRKVQAIFRYSAIYWGYYLPRADTRHRHGLGPKAMILYDTYSRTCTGELSHWFSVYHQNYFNGWIYHESPHPLVSACFLGHGHAVEVMLRENPLAKWPMDTALQPFLAAARGGHSAVLQILLNQSNFEWGSEALSISIFIAAVYGYTSIVQMLVGIGQTRIHSTQIRNEQNECYFKCAQCALWVASARGHLVIVQILVANEFVFTPIFKEALEAAALCGHEEIFWLLLERQRSGSKTEQAECLAFALRAAASSNNMNLLRRLLILGAEPNMDLGPRKENFRSAISHIMSMLKTTETELEWLRDRKEPGKKGINQNILREALDAASLRPDPLYTAWHPLLLAACYGNIEAVCLLLDRGADINLLDADGSHGQERSSALGAALDLCHYELAALLIKRGGFLPPYLATSARVRLASKFRIFARNLLEAGFSVQQAGYGPYIGVLHTALRLSCLEITKQLLQDVILAPNDAIAIAMRAFPGISLIDFAREKNVFTEIQLLLHHGVDPNMRGESHETALHISAERNWTTVLRLLLDMGAAPDALDKDGRTALHIAAERGHIDSVRILCAETDTSIMDNEDRSALRCARDRKRKDIVKHLLPFWTASDHVKDGKSMSLMDWMQQVGYWDPDRKDWNLKDIPPGMVVPHGNLKGFEEPYVSSFYRGEGYLPSHNRKLRKIPVVPGRRFLMPDYPIC